MSYISITRDDDDVDDDAAADDDDYRRLTVLPSSVHC